MAGIQHDRRSGQYLPPSEPTLRRVLGQVDDDALDRALGAFLFSQVNSLGGRFG
jgi:hypothetical protein